VPDGPFDQDAGQRDPNVCVWCGQATARTNADHVTEWVNVTVSVLTCPHETLDGRT